MCKYAKKLAWSPSLRSVRSAEVGGRSLVEVPSSFPFLFDRGYAKSARKKWHMVQSFHTYRQMWLNMYVKEIILHRTVLYCTERCQGNYTVLYCTEGCQGNYTVQSCTLLYCTVLNCTELNCTGGCQGNYTVLNCTVSLLCGPDQYTENNNITEQ
jgi:hypothetical protein